MKYCTLEYVKAHSRIEYDCEDGVLELYIESAEDVTLSILNRTVEELTEEYGQVPPAILHATLQLVDVSYSQRSPVSVTSLYCVPYTYDFLVKPYIKLV